MLFLAEDFHQAIAHRQSRHQRERRILRQSLQDVAKGALTHGGLLQLVHQLRDILLGIAGRLLQGGDQQTTGPLALFLAGEHRGRTQDHVEATAAIEVGEIRIERIERCERPVRSTQSQFALGVEDSPPSRFDGLLCVEPTVHPAAGFVVATQRVQAVCPRVSRLGDGGEIGRLAGHALAVRQARRIILLGVEEHLDDLDGRLGPPDRIGVFLEEALPDGQRLGVVVQAPVRMPELEQGVIGPFVLRQVPLERLQLADSLVILLGLDQRIADPESCFVGARVVGVIADERAGTGRSPLPTSLAWRAPWPRQKAHPRRVVCRL